MAHSVLDSVTLGFEPLWNARRQRCGFRLWVQAAQASAVDASHLAQALGALYDAPHAPLLLQVQAPALLNSLLDHPPQAGLWLAIPNDWLDDTLLAARVRNAHQRGVPLVWVGEPGTQPAARHHALFARQLHTPSPEQALQALHIARHPQRRHGRHAPARARSPIQADTLVEGLATPALVQHALDDQRAWAVVGWPSEEVLHGYRLRQLQPSQAAMAALVRALQRDDALDRIEHLLGQDPLLTYRFLRWLNSAALGLQRAVATVREGLMTVGYTRLQDWLLAQMPHASTDPELVPVRAAMVLRAHIMEQLCEAGAEDELRREVFLCGLFSQVDRLLGEPLGSAMARLPLPGRMDSAILAQTGPYCAWLEVASALESRNTAMIHGLCRAHGVAQEHANRALLRALQQSLPAR
ncbi:MAG: HDOD domain-containing protein [Rhodoferax sp.]